MSSVIWFGLLKILTVAIQDLFLIVIDLVTKLIFKIFYTSRNTKINIYTRLIIPALFTIAKYCEQLNSHPQELAE